MFSWNAKCHLPEICKIKIIAQDCTQARKTATTSMQSCEDSIGFCKPIFCPCLVGVTNFGGSQVIDSVKRVNFESANFNLL